MRLRNLSDMSVKDGQSPGRSHVHHRCVVGPTFLSVAGRCTHRHELDLTAGAVPPLNRPRLLPHAFALRSEAGKQSFVFRMSADEEPDDLVIASSQADRAIGVIDPRGPEREFGV